MKKFEFNFYVIFYLFIFLLPVFSQGAKNVTITGIGSDRDSAIRDAQRQAVESVVGIYLNSETITTNSMLLKDEIYTKTSGYIRSYKILSEGTESGVYKVTINASVTSGKIENDLAAIGLLIQQKGNPRFMVIITETSEVQSRYPISEMAIIDYLLEKEFTVVDQKAVEEVRKSDELKSIFNGDLAVASKLGSNYAADVLIIGTANSRYDQYDQPGSGYHRAKARVNIRAIRIDTGELIANAFQKINGIDEIRRDAHIRALENAGKKASYKLVKKILKRWKSETYNSGSTVQIVVSNIYDFALLSKLEQSIRSRISGVTNVTRRNYNQSNANIDVNFRGTAYSLSNLMVEAGLGINFIVTGTSQNRIKISFKNNNY